MILKSLFNRLKNKTPVVIPDEYQMLHIENRTYLDAIDKGIPYQCVYCTADNVAIRDTYYDATCPGCIRRMTK